MLGCIQPMSSPMMKRMLDFCCCWAAAGAQVAVTVAVTTTSRPEHKVRGIIMAPPTAARRCYLRQEWPDSPWSEIAASFRADLVKKPPQPIDLYEVSLDHGSGEGPQG